MEENEIIKKVITIIKGATGVEVSADKSLINDYPFDSLTIVDIEMALENSFIISFSNEDYEVLKDKNFSISCICEIIKEKLEKKYSDRLTEYLENIFSDKKYALKENVEHVKNLKSIGNTIFDATAKLEKINDYRKEAATYHLNIAYDLVNEMISEINNKI